MSILPKYDAVAESYSEADYADATAYYARRARMVVEHGPRLQPGSAVLDIACGDGGLGQPLLDLGIDYRGVDASQGMVDVARRTLGERVRLGAFEYAPPKVSRRGDHHLPVAVPRTRPARILRARGQKPSRA